MSIYLETEGGFQIKFPEQSVISLGRRDEANHQQVDIDFAELGEHGVSRLHALIHYKDDAVFIEDFNSRNGIFLNHYQMIPLRLYRLKQDDKLKLGRIELTVHLND